MKTSCTDCGKSLPKIDYVRPIRPGEFETARINYGPPRDPLCASCWQKESEDA